MSDERGNRHPADELARVRAEIKNLQEDEGKLRSEILDMSKAERKGREYKARVKEFTHRKLNVKMLEDEFGDLSRFYETREYVAVYLDKLK